MTFTSPPPPSPALATAWAADTRLGEGLLWHTASQRMFFVDIRRQRLLAWHPAQQTGQHWYLPQPTGWLLPCADGGWIAGLRDGVARIEFEGRDTPAIEWVHRLHQPGQGMRLNDAKVDAFGCVWFGTMHNEKENEPHGRLLRLHPDGRLDTVEEALCVPNGPAVSLDGRVVLHNDSSRRLTWRYTLDDAGAIAERSLWRETTGTEAREGYPDGMCFDADGMVWQARWGAACVVRMDAQGRELQRVHTGAPHTSNCCFGGPGLSDLYITTANALLDDAARTATPQAGSLLVLPRAGKGLPARAWGGAGRLQGRDGA
jgi:sugar lactone lactonase YvrE